MKFRKKPTVIEAITFDELVQHAKDQGVPLHGESQMPWSFEYGGHRVTHETDDCYLIPTLEGTMRFERGDMLITGVAGEIYPCKAEIFARTYESACDYYHGSAACEHCGWQQPSAAPKEA